MHLFACTCDEFADALFSMPGGRAHAFDLYRRALKYGDCTGLPSEITCCSPEIADMLEHEGVVKIVFRLADGARIETVIIPAANRTTLCVSSQAGCRMGCQFCATGASGFYRNLLPEEIVGQVFAVRHGLGRSVDNVVFMGMGEPLDNVGNVVQSLMVLSDQRGFDIALRHITVSTVGLPDGLHHLGGLGLSGLRLAISLNAANDRLRSYLMPVNRSYPLAVLKQALQSYPLRKKEVFFIEYVLLKGVNDTQEHAAQLALFTSDIPSRVNVIGYNAGQGGRFASPSTEACRHFCMLLAREGVFVRLRSSRGQGIQAACGQLGTALR
jgi:23S rRNA (adenine2503-C2)-methyltransferase